MTTNRMPAMGTDARGSTRNRPPPENDKALREQGSEGTLQTKHSADSTPPTARLQCLLVGFLAYDAALLALLALIVVGALS
ncbi:MAG: hypothetical protein Q8O52_28925 [Sulfuritalea sp.]|nr:hypothetical protein [Sulfuritalea sp.]